MPTIGILTAQTPSADPLINVPTVRGCYSKSAGEPSSAKNVTTACSESLGKLDTATNDQHVQSNLLLEDSMLRNVLKPPPDAIKEDLDEVILQAKCKEYEKDLNTAFSHVISEPKPFPGRTFLCSDSFPVLSSEGCLRNVSTWDPPKPWGMTPILFTDSEIELLRNPGEEIDVNCVFFSSKTKSNMNGPERMPFQDDMKSGLFKKKT